MSAVSQMDRLRAEGMLPHQAQFIVDFMRPDSAPLQQLVSLVGTGRLYMVGALIREIFRQQEGVRMLILTRNMLLYQVANIVAPDSSSVPVQIIDTRAFREMQSQSEAGSSPWPQSIVAVSSIDWAKQFPAREAIVETHWDLVVVDEAHNLSATRRALVKELIDRGTAGRLLLLASVVDAHAPEPPFPDVVTTHWPVEIRDWDGRILWRLPSRSRRMIVYRRSPEEIEFLHNLQEFLGSLPTSTQNSFRAKVLIRAASSSLYAIGDSLRRFRNRIAHDVTLGANENLGEGDDADLADVEGIALDAGQEGGMPTHDATFVAEVRSLLRLFEGVQTDAKGDAFRSLVSELSIGENDERILVFTSYASTASYVRSLVEEMGNKAFLITGSSAKPEHVIHAIEELRKRGGVLVTTDVLSGFSLPGVHIGINYDLPSLEAEMDQRWARILRPPLEGTASTMYAFRDESGALSSEELLLKRYGFFDHKP